MTLAADDGVIATAAAKGATITTYSAAGISAVIGWINSLDWVAVSSICVALVTGGVNWYYKRARRQDEHQESLQRQRLNDLEMQAKIALLGRVAAPAEPTAGEGDVSDTR